MIYVACGYSGTGSSAIVHLLSEYSNCTLGNLGTFEHLPFYTPNGLFDLEDRLLRNNAIHTSDAALSLFYDAMKRLNDNDFGWFGGYQKRFGNQFMQIVDEFVCELTQYTLSGYWSFDFYYKRTLKAVIRDSIKTIMRRKVPKFGYSCKKNGDGIVRYSFVNAEEFYTAAKRFVKKYVDMISGDESKILVCDQLLLPQNLYRIENYFDEDSVRVIVVDRDPRDMFVLSKYVWPRMGSKPLFPTDVDDFVKFYTALKQTERIAPSKLILRLHFEDLIYKYDDTIATIEEFLGEKAGEHIRVKSHFKPDVSIKNTQNFRIEEAWTTEVSVIESAMKDMLYDFPYTISTNIEDTSDPQ